MHHSFDCYVFYIVRFAFNRKDVLRMYNFTPSVARMQVSTLYARVYVLMCTCNAIDTFKKASSKKIPFHAYLSVLRVVNKQQQTNYIDTQFKKKCITRILQGCTAVKLPLLFFSGGRCNSVRFT